MNEKSSLDYPGGPNVIRRTLVRWSQESQRRDVMRKQCGIMCFEYGGKAPKPRGAGSLEKEEKAREWIPLQSLQKEPALLTLDFQPSETDFEL